MRRVLILAKLYGIRQVTVLQLGGFATNLVTNMEKAGFTPAQDAYTNRYPVKTTYERSLEAIPLHGDPEKAAEVIYKVSELPEPPLRFQLGQDAVQAVKGHLERVLEELGKYKSWSDDPELILSQFRK